MRKLFQILLLCFLGSLLSCEKETIVTATIETTNQPPSPFTLEYPINEHVLTQGGWNIAFVWEQATDPENDEINYELHLLKDGASFGVYPTGRFPRYSSSPFTKQMDGNYSWFVLAKDGNGGETKSEIRNFSVQISNSPPTTPTLLTPSDNYVLTQPGSIKFSWGAVSDPDGDTVNYLMAFVNPDGSASLFLLGSLTEYSYHFTASDNGEYKWNVVARDGNGGESGSLTRTFKIDI